MFTPLECTADSVGFAFCPPSTPSVPAPIVGDPAWPDFVDGLDIATCPTTSVVTVTSTAHQAFVDALTDAIDVESHVTIRFDEQVFPRANPQVIQLDPVAVPFPSGAASVCIDARGAGVVLQWISSRDDDADVWRMASQSRLYGLTLVGLPRPLVFNGGQLAGNRFNTPNGLDVVSGVAPYLIEMVGNPTVGPGNVFAGAELALLGSSGASIHDNGFGWDVLSLHELYLDSALEARANAGVPLVFTANQAHVVSNGVRGLAGLADIAVTANQIIAENGRYGVDVVGSTGVISNNLILGFSAAAKLDVTSTALLSRNSYYFDDIDIATESTLVPPGVVSWTAAAIQGTCERVGTVEVYENSGELHNYMTTADCDGTFWSAFAPYPPQATRTLTATLSVAGVGTSRFSAAFTAR